MNEQKAGAGVAEVSSDLESAPSPDPDVAAQKRASAVEYLRGELEAADAAVDRAKAKVVKFQELAESAEGSVSKAQADRDDVAAALAAAEQEVS